MHENIIEPQLPKLQTAFTQSPTARDTFQPMPGLISYTGVTESVGITCHACITQIADRNPQSSRAQVAEDCCVLSRAIWSW